MWLLLSLLGKKVYRTFWRLSYWLLYIFLSLTHSTRIYLYIVVCSRPSFLHAKLVCSDPLLPTIFNLFARDLICYKEDISFLYWRRRKPERRKIDTGKKKTLWAYFFFINQVLCFGLFVREQKQLSELICKESLSIYIYKLWKKSMNNLSFVCFFRLFLIWLLSSVVSTWSYHLSQPFTSWLSYMYIWNIVI